MNPVDDRLKRLDDRSPSADERAVLRCRVASEFTQAGRYEAACAALGGFWRGLGVRPEVLGLGERAAAEVLLQVGALSGWLDACGRASEAQEAAKEIIGESAALFDAAGDAERAALARSDLALCCWRQGAHGEAREILEDAHYRARGGEFEHVVALRLAFVLTSAGRYAESLALLNETAALLDGAGDGLRGSFHNESAVVLGKLGASERRADYLERALAEYTAAAFHYGRAGHERHAAHAENDLALLLHKLGRRREAHDHLDRAQLILAGSQAHAVAARVDETRALVLIDEGRYREADAVIARAVRTLEGGGAAAPLAESLTTQGVARARLGDAEGSAAVLLRALRVAEEAGALAAAGRAALTLIEEHGAGPAFSLRELNELYARADELLSGTQDPEDVARLRACARVVIRRAAGLDLHDRDFSFQGAIYDLESRFIEQALEEAGGSVTRAARLLGVGHQSLSNMLRSRHQTLMKKRRPARNRRKDVVRPAG